MNTIEQIKLVLNQIKESDKKNGTIKCPECQKITLQWMKQHNHHLWVKCDCGFGFIQ